MVFRENAQYNMQYIKSNLFSSLMIYLIEFEIVFETQFNVIKYTQKPVPTGVVSTCLKFKNRNSPVLSHYFSRNRPV